MMEGVGLPHALTAHGRGPQAAVADRVMESGKTARHGNGSLCVPNRSASEARRPEAGGVRDVEGWRAPVPSGMSEQRT